MPDGAWQGQRWLTAGVELRDAGALALGLGGGLAYLPLEGGEEVLAKLFRHVCLQVGLHEEAKALVVDGLGRGQRVMEVPREGVLYPGSPSPGTSAAELSPPRTASFPNRSAGISPKRTGGAAGTW